MLVPAESHSKTLPPSRVVCPVPHTCKSIASFVVFGCTLLAICYFGLAKVIAQDSKTDDDVVSVSTDLLLFPIRIKTRQNQAVQGLTENDLSLDDKDRVTTGLYFAPGADRIALVFALDQSGSLREIISQQQEAALALFQRFSDRSTIAVLSSLRRLRWSRLSIEILPKPARHLACQPETIDTRRYSMPQQKPSRCLTPFLACGLNAVSWC